MKKGSGSKAKSSVLKEIMELADSVMTDKMKDKVTGVKIEMDDEDDDKKKKGKGPCKEDYAKMLGM